MGLAGIMEERRCSVERDREGEVARVCRSTDWGGEVGGLIHGLKPEEEARREVQRALSPRLGLKEILFAPVVCSLGSLFGFPPHPVHPPPPQGEPCPSFPPVSGRPRDGAGRGGWDR